MKTKLFLVAAALLASVTMMAAIGPQSVKVTFNGSDSEGWVASSGGSITSVADGVANVQMAAQSGTPTKYRADFQYNTTGFTMDKSKDVVWAIKLTAALPGTENSRKFEIQYNDGSSDHWINDISGPSGALDCVDGGKIYYFDLTTISAKIDKTGQNPGIPFEYASFTDATLAVKKIHFIFADATGLTAETAKYAVDWVASFTSVNALIDFKDWNDEAQDATASLPYLELGFLPKADGTGYEIRRNGFVDAELEGNYKVKLFAIEYFLIEDFSKAKQYTLKLETTGGGGFDAIAVWDFPYQITSNDDAAALNTKAATVTGVVPGSTSGTSAIEPIASSTCDANFWTLALPGSQLTPLATIGGKTLVGLFVTSQNLIEAKSAKFASAANAEKAKPALVESGIDPSVIILNTTQQRVENTLAEAVEHANANDVITIYNDVTISGSRLEIKKELTIQGATGAEKIICGVPATTLMVLANGNDENYTVTFKNLTIDDETHNARSLQLIEATNKGQLCFESVSVINASYLGVGCDVKSQHRDVILKGNNSFCAGIYLFKDIRIESQYATHTSPIRIVLGDNYQNDYVVVKCFTDESLYNVVNHEGATLWYLYNVNSGSCGHELKAKKRAITLAENDNNASTLLANDGLMANVTLNRTVVRNDNYSTFCAPFAISRSALEAQLGTTEVLRYKYTAVVNDVATLVFDDDVEDLEAGVPYLIKPASGDNVTSMTFNGVTIDNTVRPAEDSHYQFIPLFSQEVVSNTGAQDKSVVYLGAGNQLYWAGATCTIKGFRAYLKAKNPESPAMKAVKRMVIDRYNTPTGIENTSAKLGESQKILRDGQIVIIRDGIEYNLMGQKVK